MMLGKIIEFGWSRDYMIVKELQLPILDVSHHFDSEDLEYDVLVFWNDHLVLLKIEKWSDFIRHVH